MRTNSCRSQTGALWHSVRLHRSCFADSWSRKDLISSRDGACSAQRTRSEALLHRNFKVLGRHELTVSLLSCLFRLLVYRPRCIEGTQPVPLRRLINRLATRVTEDTAVREAAGKVWRLGFGAEVGSAAAPAAAKREPKLDVHMCNFVSSCS